MTRFETALAVTVVLFVALFVWIGVSRPPYVAPASDAQMPAGSELIFYNDGPAPIRVIKVGECYITQVVPDHGNRWLVLNRGELFGAEASIDCVSGQAPTISDDR